MTIFTNLRAAEEHGFRWFEFHEAACLHLVVKDCLRDDGLRVRMLAFARPLDPGDLEALEAGLLAAVEGV